ncbi:hypothetical protein M427DRAFT_44514 [Gonapodya prolifera JEL478]|uniref:F-box domain-containing protein n=1 Tax=Gonapodya prolifera (strain JEL478) TaxID=1344416 RepID=A0A139AGC3_GONPJ|nr:hypothetical protein M427DRAFT_44514 [Gonapodya prolifera JEL478]|eukprot:KXS15463.1 hypothetical protein M427DRAFT_44514 [Gonapodya prolifera JEL478]
MDDLHNRPFKRSLAASLPPEILVRICSQLPPITCHSLALVSRSWNFAATPTLYKSPTIISETWGAAVKAAKWTSLRQTLISNPELGRMVARLDIREREICEAFGLSSDGSSHEEFVAVASSILNATPRLVELNFDIIYRVSLRFICWRSAVLLSIPETGLPRISRFSVTIASRRVATVPTGSYHICEHWERVPLLLPSLESLATARCDNDCVRSMFSRPLPKLTNLEIVDSASLRLNVLADLAHMAPNVTRLNLLGAAYAGRWADQKEYFTMLEEAIIKMFDVWKGLKLFYLTPSAFPPACVEALTSLQHIHTIAIGAESLGDPEIRLLCSRPLKALYLHRASRITDESLKWVSDMVSLGDTEVLWIGGAHQLSDVGIESLAQGLGKGGRVRILCLESCLSLTGRSVRALVTHGGSWLSNHLELLDLSGCPEIAESGDGGTGKTSPLADLCSAARNLRRLEIMVVSDSEVAAHDFGEIRAALANNGGSASFVTVEAVNHMGLP